MTSLLGSRKKLEGEDTGEGEGRGGRGTQRGGRERKGRPGAGSSAGSSREDSSSPVEGILHISPVVASNSPSLSLSFAHRISGWISHYGDRNKEWNT